MIWTISHTRLNSKTWPIGHFLRVAIRLALLTPSLSTWSRRWEWTEWRSSMVWVKPLMAARWSGFLPLWSLWSRAPLLRRSATTRVWPAIIQALKLHILVHFLKTYLLQDSVSVACKNDPSVSPQDSSSSSPLSGFFPLHE